MIIKPNGSAYFGAALLAVAVGATGAFCIYAIIMRHYDYLWYCALPLFVFVLFFASRNICLWCKTVEMCLDGYWVSFLGMKRLYRWENVKIKRIEDCTKVLGRRNTVLYPECLFISIHKKQRPQWCNPVEFCVFTHPFSSVYASFKPEKKETANMLDTVGSMLGTVECILLDKQELLDVLKSFGVELDK